MEKGVMRPIGIDLFAGAGGLSLGFEQAGFDVVAAVEIDPIHCAVHKFNFPNSVVIPQSVETLTATDIRRLAGIGERDIDCVFGGAPCQGFSLIGRRVFDDPRNRLVLDFVRLVSELNARTFVFENVKGLTVGKHKAFLAELVEAFDAVGYNVRLPWKVLNAANFGVPQFRERLFIMGSRRGENLPDYPFATTNIAGRLIFDRSLPVGPTCGDAIGDLPDIDKYDELINLDSVRFSTYGSPSRYAAEMRCLDNDAFHQGYVRSWDSSSLTSSARTEHSTISRRRFSSTEPGSVEPISRFFKLPYNGVSNTLRAGTDGARGAFTSPRPIHFKHNRCISVREMARLHGFPDWFRFHVTKWHGARQIGNSVPPPLARAVAKQIFQSLAIESSTPSEVMELGDVNLLKLDLSGASLFFNVPTPKSRRDQKSGMRKRKQIDIERELSGITNYD